MELPHGLLGSAIKKARLDKSLTQEKLAEIINITPTHMKQIESERRNPSIDVLYRIVYALDLSIDSLFSIHSDKTQELRNKINLCLNRCNERELHIVYTVLETLLKIDQ